jgi:hypothetical protein
MRFRPYSFFFLLSIGVLIEGYLIIKEAKSAIDRQFYDTTYFEEGIIQFYGGLSFVLFGLWCIYALTDRYIFPLNTWLTRIHLIFTLLGLGGLYYTSQLGFNYTVVGDAQEKVILVQAAVLLFLIGQLMFPINIFRSVILRARNRPLEE